MLSLLNLFVDIALLRRNPQDVPASATLMQVCAGLAVVSYVLAISPVHAFGESVLRALFDVAFLGAFVYVVLRLAGHPLRFTQSFTALCGTGVLLNLIAWPLFVTMGANTAEQRSTAESTAAIVLIVMMIWVLLINAHIFRHSIGSTFSGGLLISLGYMILAFLLTNMIFAQQAA